MAKARTKPTIPHASDCLPIAELVRRVVLSDNPDDWKALVEATASLIEARDNDRRRLESRRLDKSLTLEERELLAAPPRRQRGLGRRGRPKQPKPSSGLKEELAKRILVTALAAKAQWRPGYTIKNLIADVQAASGLNRSYAFALYRAIVGPAAAEERVNNQKQPI